MKTVVSILAGSSSRQRGSPGGGGVAQRALRQRPTRVPRGHGGEGVTERLDAVYAGELTVAGGSASYIGRATNPGEKRPTAELVLDEPLLLAEPTPIRANPVSAYLAGLAESSRRPMRTNLETIARLVSGGRVPATELAWWRLRYEHTSLIRSTLAETYAPATANLMLSAMRGVLKACFRLGYMSVDDLQRASDVPPARGSRLPPGRAVERGELFALFRLCYEDNKKARGARDAALFALLYACGLRRSEAVSLDLSDYDPESLEVRVRGKGNKERMVYAEGVADRAVNLWAGLRGDGPGALFLPLNKGGTIARARTDPDGEVVPARLSDQAVYDVVRRRHKEAGIKKLSPHDFRKTFVGDCSTPWATCRLPTASSSSPGTPTPERRRATTGAASGRRGRRRGTSTCPTSAIRLRKEGCLPLGGPSEALRGQPRVSNKLRYKPWDLARGW